MSGTVRHVGRFINQTFWAIREATLDIVVEIVRMRAAGITMSADEVRARIGAAEPPRPVAVNAGGGTVAILPLCGVIGPKMNAFTQISGGTSLDKFMSRFRTYRDDPSVSAIVIDADTPGGSVYGVPEAADEIFASRGAKPIVAVVNPSCASAGLWITAQCSRVVCTPSGDYGSLGVFVVHEDWSKANEQMGYKPTYISFGEYKTEGNPDEPLADETRAYLQQQVDKVGKSFITAVARGRGVEFAKVRDTYGKGRMIMAGDALKIGMVDEINTIENVVAKLLGGRKRTSAALAASALCDTRHVQVSSEMGDLGTPTIVAVTDPYPPKEPIDGVCPDGYEMDPDDGMCYLIARPSTEKQTPNPEPDTAAAEALDAEAQRDRDHLDLMLAELDTV